MIAHLKTPVYTKNAPTQMYDPKKKIMHDEIIPIMQK